jgi:hypothetical protein
VQVIVEGLVLYPSSKKEDLAECAQISYLLWSRIWMLCSCKKLENDNKEEELVDVAPGWE